MLKDKKKFLKSYLLQQSKIERLREMILTNPSKETEYLAQISECQSLRNIIEEKIELIDNEVLKELLIQKYICGRTLEEISIIMRYSKRHTERLHILALETLDI